MFYVTAHIDSPAAFAIVCPRAGLRPHDRTWASRPVKTQRAANRLARELAAYGQTATVRDANDGCKALAVYHA